MSLVAFGLVLAAASASAGAYRIRRPPALPILGDYDAIATARVTSHDRYGAEIRIDEVLDGRLDSRTAHLGFGVGRPGEIVVTSPGPPGPRVETGARVAVVFKRHEGRQLILGWMALDEAARTDDFFMLYQRANRRSEKQRLLVRWRQVNRYRGPVPLSDPEHWLPPHVGGLGWVGPDGLAYVELTVAADGSIATCQPWHGNPPSPGNATICDGIRHRRFAPPLFARERRGMFRIRWNEQAGAGR